MPPKEKNSSVQVKSRVLAYMVTSGSGAEVELHRTGIEGEPILQIRHDGGEDVEFSKEEWDAVKECGDKLFAEGGA